MKYDDRHGRYVENWELDLEPERVPSRPAPGKVTLTESIPVQRRAKRAARPAQKVPDLPPFSFVQAYSGECEFKEPASAAFPDEVPVAFLGAKADQACRDAFDFDYSKPVQRTANTASDGDANAVHAAAARGIEAPSQQLPHLDQIQKSFGHHDVSHVQAHVGGAAAEASAAMGAEAYATGGHVAFASSPDVHTAAHEAAHVVQQKDGVQLKGGVGEAGDVYERHADAAANKVVAGESAEALLDEMAGSASSSVSPVQMKKGDGPAPPATASSVAAFASPMTELATQAKDVVQAAEFAGLALHAASVRNPPDAELVRLSQQLTAFAKFLHHHAGERAPSDEAALQAALRAADGIAKQLRGQSRFRTFERELRDRIAEVNRVVRENTAREAKLESPAALVAMNEGSRASIVRWKLFADAQRQALPGIAADSLNAPVVTATAWDQLLQAQPDSVEHLARAIVDQHEVVIMVDAELSQVVRQPVSETTTETINAYLHVLVISSGQRQRSDQALELARAKRRRLPLDRAEAALKSGEQHMLHLERRDPSAGREARAEHDELRKAHKLIEGQIARGKSPDPGDLEDFVLETREYEFLHRVDLLRLQAKQALDAIDQIKAERTAEKVRAQRRLGDLIQTLDGHRARYKETAFEAKYEQPEEARAKKKELLRYSEIQLQHALKDERYEATLQEAQDVLDDQIVAQFLSQLIWTVALTISGNFVAAAARGAAAGVGARIGASLTTTTRVANIVANVSEGVYGAFTQKYIQGDQGSLTTLLAVNILTPFAVDRVMRLGRTAERIGEGAADAAAKSERLLDDAAMLSKLDDVALDEDELVSFSARMDRAAKKSVWGKGARTGALGLRGGANLTAEMIMGAAVDYAIRRAKEEGGRPPSDQTAAEWLMQGASMAIGRHISVNVRAVRSRLAAVESGASSATDSILNLADTVAADAKTLEEGGPHTAVPEVANNYAKVLADEQAFLQKELADAVDGRGKRSRKHVLGLLAGNRHATGELGKLASGELADSHRGVPDGDEKTRVLKRIREGTPGTIRTESELSNADVVKSLDVQLAKVSPDGVDEIAARFPGQENEAKLVMARSSGFGTMESMNDLRVAMDKDLKSGFKLFTPGRGSLADNIAYAADKEAFGSVPGADHNSAFMPATTNVLEDNAIVVLDPVVLDMIKNKPGFAQELVHKNCKLIEPKGFTGGINMFNAKDPTKIAEHTRRILDRATAIMSEGKAGDLEAAISVALSEGTLKTLKDAGVTTAVKVVHPAEHADVSAAAISQQVSGTQGITEAELKTELDKLLDDNQRSMARELLAHQAEVFSPRRFAADLAAKHAEIMARVAPTPPDQVFFLIPKDFKSYGMIAMAHREATGTRPGQYLNGPQDAQGLPADAVIVIFDDVAGSGDSLHQASAALGKGKHRRQPAITNFPGQVIVAPMVSTEMAKQLFDDPAKSNLSGAAGLSFDPQQMSKALTESDFFKSLDVPTQNKLIAMIRPLGFAQNAVSMVFPYMSPDNNNHLFWKHFAKYFIMNRNQEAAKAPAG